MSCLIKRAINGGFLSGCRILRSRQEYVLIPHLLFVNVAILFAEPNWDQMLCLNVLLVWFASISGLQNQLGKNQVHPVGTMENVELAEELGCKMEIVPSAYLDIPVDAPYKFEAVWDAVDG